MKDYLGSLVKQLDGVGLWSTGSDFEDGVIEECVRNIRGTVRQALQFDLGRFEDVLGQSKRNHPAQPLPFPTIFVAWEGTDHDLNPVTGGLLCHKQSGVYRGDPFDYKVWVFRYRPCSSMWSLHFVNTFKIGSALMGSLHNRATPPDDLDCGDAAFLAAGLQALNCSNVHAVEHLPSRLRVARAKKTGSPLYSTWTLEIKGTSGSKDRGMSLGGTHASPRVHLRRGHIRHYDNGKTIWVQPCVVGNKENGMIDKDYKLVTEI